MVLLDYSMYFCRSSTSVAVQHDLLIFTAFHARIAVKIADYLPDWCAVLVTMEVLLSVVYTWIR